MPSEVKFRFPVAPPPQPSHSAQVGEPLLRQDSAFMSSCPRALLTVQVCQLWKVTMITPAPTPGVELTGRHGASDPSRSFRQLLSHPGTQPACLASSSAVGRTSVAAGGRGMAEEPEAPGSREELGQMPRFGIQNPESRGSGSRASRCFPSKLSPGPLSSRPPDSLPTCCHPGPALTAP